MRKVITISRQFGAGGGELGRRTAKALGLPFYDKDLVLRTAMASSGLTPEQVQRWDERVPVTFGFTQSLFDFYNRPLSDKLWEAQVKAIRVEPRLMRFIAQIVHETRNDRSLYLGASPRASIALMQVAKAFAVLRGRSFVIPEDVIEAVNPVLRHRISLTPEREMEGATTDEVLKELVARLEIPR